jgi:hypothetical protein
MSHERSAFDPQPHTILNYARHRNPSVMLPLPAWQIGLAAAKLMQRIK